MVKTRIGELARKAGFQKARHFQLESGLSSSMASRLFNDEINGLELQTIDRLCEFFGCEPGDLFVREASAKTKRPVKKVSAPAAGRATSKQGKADAAKH